MITSLEINNFRMFSCLKIEKLSRVNLISGKNNAGKSSFLESVFLHNSGFNIHSIYQVLLDREEMIDRNVKSGSISPIRHFFSNHKADVNNFSQVVIKSNIDETSIDIGYLSNTRDLFSDGVISYKESISNYDKVFNEEDLSFILNSEKTGERVTVPYYSIYSDPMDYMRARRRVRKPQFNTLNVPSSGASFDDMVLLWDSISLTNLERHIIEALKIVEERVVGVAMVQQSRESSRRIPIVKLRHIDEAVTLKSLGDGMGRIFQIILSLVNCKNGTLLIDEFENGLHWSVQDKVWDIIFDLSKKLNIQVFCTSHSRDCISSFVKSWKDRATEGCFFRIENDYRNELVSIKGYDMELLSDSLNYDVEVR